MTTVKAAVHTVKRHKWSTPWLFSALAVIIIAGFSLYPFINTIILSFTDATPLKQGQFVGFANFDQLLHDDRFWTALLNSSLYVVCVVPILVIAPLALAVLINVKRPLTGFFRTSYYIPVVTSAVAVGIMWSWILDSRGLVNDVFQALHFITQPIPFLSDRWLLLFSAMFVTIWMGMGYYMVIYLAALANVPQDLYDAAAVDGASAWRRFWSVTVPGVRSTMVLIGVLSAVSAFRVFTEVYVLSGNSGGPGGQDTTLVMLIQDEGTGLNAQLGYSSAISVVMFLITIGLMIAIFKMQRQEDAS